MRKHPIVCFYVLAFGIAWLGWLPLVAASRGIPLFSHPAFQSLLILPAIGPALAAIPSAAWCGPTRASRGGSRHSSRSRWDAQR